jgi:hypothetical protein
LQNLKVVALPLAVLMPPNDGTNLYMMALGLSRLGVVSWPLVLSGFSELSERSGLSVLQDNGTICEKHKTTGFSLHRLNPKSIK